MSRPKLQIALDHNDLEQALADVFQVGDIVDIIEIGTILCLQEGRKAISCIRSMFQGKQLLLIQNVRMPGNGIQQVIYHQSRDALLSGETWGERDLTKVKKLIEMGFAVSVTGGLNVETLKLFAGIEVETFIAGRGISSADDPAKAANDFKQEMIRIWGNRLGSNRNL